MKISLAKLLRPLLAVSCTWLIGSSAWAAGPNTLLVVRASDNSLWKATCTAGVCSSFTNFPGEFGSQPTVTWEDRDQTWLLFGTAPDGTLWKSSFTDLGVFQNNWVNIPGAAANPPGAASRGLAHLSGSNYGLGSTVMTTQPFNTVFNIHTHPISAVNGTGFFQCTATGMASITRTNTTGDNVVFFGLSTVSATMDSSGGRWTAIDIPPGTPTGLTSIPISVTAWFLAPPASTGTVYVVGFWRGANTGATITMRNVAHHCDYHPYSD